jgi:hypothetical protein
MAKKKADEQEYEYSLTKPVEEEFTQDEIDALVAETGKPIEECNTELVTSEDGKTHTYTVTPKEEVEKPDAVVVVPVNKKDDDDQKTDYVGPPQKKGKDKGNDDS